MKKIGIIGGLAWPSTIDYYRYLCSRCNDRHRKQGGSEPSPTPPMVIESVNIAETRQLRGIQGDDDSWRSFDAVFNEAFQRLRLAGADFGLIASNTPHSRFNSITRNLDFHVLNILDTTADTIIQLGMGRAMILGTPVTIRSPMYHDALSAHGINVADPIDDTAIDELAELIDGSLYHGEVDVARQWILDAARSANASQESLAVCLACTELPLAFPEHRDDASFIVDGITFINTTIAHADAAFELALDETKAH